MEIHKRMKEMILYINWHYLQIKAMEVKDQIQQEESKIVKLSLQEELVNKDIH